MMQEFKGMMEKQKKDLGILSKLSENAEIMEKVVRWDELENDDITNWIRHRANMQHDIGLIRGRIEVMQSVLESIERERSMEKFLERARKARENYER